MREFFCNARHDSFLSSFISTNVKNVNILSLLILLHIFDQCLARFSTEARRPCWPGSVRRTRTSTRRRRTRTCQCSILPPPRVIPTESLVLNRGIRMPLPRSPQADGLPFSPFSIFALVHATRVAAAYRGVARQGGYDHKLGGRCLSLSLSHDTPRGLRLTSVDDTPKDLQAAIVTLVLVLGGSTVSNLLLGTVPGWVVSPIPVLTYGSVFSLSTLKKRANSKVLNATTPG